MISIPISGGDLQGIMPLIVATGFGILILLLDAFQRPSTSRSYLGHLAILGLIATGLSAYVLWHTRATVDLFSGMVYLDGFGQAFTCIFVLAGILTCLLAPSFLESHQADRGEFYALVIFAVTGMIMVAISGNLIMIFLGLETLSVSAYVLAGFFRSSRESAEASMKYLVLGALSTGIMLFGIALIYGVTGTTDLSEIGRIFAGGMVDLPEGLRSVLPDGALDDPERAMSIVSAGHLVPVAFLGMVLLLVSIGFKVSAVPFHMWTPDVYTGSPTPVVGFMASAVKTAGFAALLRVFVTCFFGDAARNSSTGWVQVFFVLALLSMVVGNFGALVQSRLKRMLAYSSIAHVGYMLIALTAAGYTNEQGYVGAIVFYLVAYSFGTIGAFGVLTILGRRGESVETYEDLNELGYKYPWLGLSMTVFMLSAAGIPPTAGFFAKFLAFKSAVDASIYNGGGPAPMLMIVLAAAGILVSVAGVYYYLKVVVHMYMRSATREIRALPSRGAALAVAVCLVASLGLGLLPQRLKFLSHYTAILAADTPSGPTAQTLGDLERAQEEAAEADRAAAPEADSPDEAEREAAAQRTDE